MTNKPSNATLAKAREPAELVERAGLSFGIDHPYSGYPLAGEARAQPKAHGSSTATSYVTDRNFDDFVAGGADCALNRHLMGI